MQSVQKTAKQKQVMRMKKSKITEAEYNEVKALMKANKLKRVDKRLHVILLRYEGLSLEAIAEKLGYTVAWVSKLCTAFKLQGIQEYARHKYGGNHKSLSDEQEREIIDSFTAKAELGQVVTAADIKKEFDKQRGKDTGRGYIYMVLARHNWRMVMPRGKHPNKASDEDIESSKKLTQNTTN